MQEEMKIKDGTANPAPLGLLAFGMTTILLNVHNAGFFPLDAMIMAMGVFFAGIGQVIVGYMEWKKKNTFGALAFSSYGYFWLVLVGSIIGAKLGLTPSNPMAMGVFLSLWGIYSFGMFICTLKASRALQVVFGSLVILFALLAIRDFTGNEAIGVIAGYEGIFCGLSAMYTAMGEVINEMYGRSVLPLGDKK